jgi:hypothetical protein
MNKKKDSAELTKQEIRELYKWIALDSTYDESDAKGIPIAAIYEACFEFYNALIRIEDFVTEVLSSDDPGFVKQNRLLGRKDFRIEKESIVRLPLADYFPHVIKLLENYSPEYKYSHNVDLFFKCCFKLELGKEWFRDPSGYTTKRGDKPKTQLELFHELIDLIRTESKTAEYDDKISHREHNATRNYESAVPFVTELFSQRQLVLRVDLYYQPEYAITTSAEEARADLAHFLYTFRHNKGLTKYLNGYLWKMEFGHLKGMHIHMLFFYDGANVKDDEYWANRIGTFWKDVITKGRGRYYNGNTAEHKAEYDKAGLLGIGMIDRINEDQDKDTRKKTRDILLTKIVKYLLKADQYLLATKLDNIKGRIYGKGYGPDWREKKKA